MEVVGFALIKKDAEVTGALRPEKFRGQFCRVMEFVSESYGGGALLLCPDGSALGSVEQESISGSFECKFLNGIVIPPNLNMYDEMNYVSRVMSRKGGYNQLLANMVIANSVRCGEFNDKFLWVNQ